MKTKTFQKSDLARAALHDGLILAWDTGLGKTWALFLWPLLKVGFNKIWVALLGQHVLQPKAAVLILAPGDLHAQIRKEGWDHFRISVTAIETQADFQRLTTSEDGQPRRSADGRPRLAPGFYITSYSQLSINGVLRPPDVNDEDFNPREVMRELCLHERGLTEEKPRMDTDAHGYGAARPRSSIRENPCESVVQELPHSPHNFFRDRREEVWNEHYTRLHFGIDQTIAELDLRYAAERASASQIQDQELRREVLNDIEESYRILKMLCCHKPKPKFLDLNGAQQDFVLRNFLGEYLAHGMSASGQVKRYPIGPIPEGFDINKPETDTRARWAIKCIYSPSLADLCYHAFDCVVIDEGVKMKGTDTYVGQAVRSLIPKYRLVLTATPVKNRLRDIFWLCWWAAGGSDEATARWPYRNDSAECERFAGEFMVSERNISKEDAAREKGQSVGGRFTKLTAEVCNIHRLWKLMGPNILRRRKQDAGEDIVPKIRKVVRCELGREQRRVYQYHLDCEYVDKNGMEAVVVRLQSLRMAAADPSSEHLPEKAGQPCEPCGPCKGLGYLDPRKPKSTCSACNGVGRHRLPFRSHTSYTPKMATTLQLVQEILARNEQVVVFSAFNDPLDQLSQRLDEAEVRHIKLDGRTSQKKRGDLGAVFKRGRYRTQREDPNDAAIPVMLAGVECMAEGHSFHLANNVILIAYSWAYDKFVQALNRVHRMNSPKPVNVYVVIANGTIDRKLEALIQEKGDAAELVLDGQLIGERTEEVNLAELLKIARKEFREGDNTIEEARLEQDWPSLRNALRLAHEDWHASAPVMEIETTTTKGKMKSKPRFDTNINIGAKRTNIVPLDGHTADNIVPVTFAAPAPKADNSRAAWMQRMRQRASALASVQTADVGFEAL